MDRDGHTHGDGYPAATDQHAMLPRLQQQYVTLVRSTCFRCCCPIVVEHPEPMIMTGMHGMDAVRAPAPISCVTRYIIKDFGAQSAITSPRIEALSKRDKWKVQRYRYGYGVDFLPCRQWYEDRTTCCIGRFVVSNAVANNSPIDQPIGERESEREREREIVRD